MTAQLDRTRSWGGDDRNGGMSDPTLIKRLGPVEQITDEQAAAVRRLIAEAFPEDCEEFIRSEMEQMLLGPSEGDMHIDQDRTGADS